MDLAGHLGRGRRLLGKEELVVFGQLGRPVAIAYAHITEAIVYVSVAVESIGWLVGDHCHRVFARHASWRHRAAFKEWHDELWHFSLLVLLL